MTKHRTRAELVEGLPHILASPKDGGRVEMLVVRPAENMREPVEKAHFSLAGGMAGDHWAKGCWKSTEDGAPHPDVQICIMNARCIALVAGPRENWPPAGDNVFLDMDLSPENLPPGTRIAMGDAVLEITDTPHNGCAKFIERYGRDACVFVNTHERGKYRLRGIYGRVVQDGEVRKGDIVRKLPAASVAAE